MLLVPALVILVAIVAYNFFTGRKVRLLILLHNDFADWTRN